MNVRHQQIRKGLQVETKTKKPHTHKTTQKIQLRMYVNEAEITRRKKKKKKSKKNCRKSST